MDEPVDNTNAPRRDSQSGVDAERGGSSWSGFEVKNGLRMWTWAEFIAMQVVASDAFRSAEAGVKAKVLGWPDD